MLKKIISSRTFGVLSIILTAFSLFNLYIRINESGISAVFLDAIMFYRAIADFLFGWIMKYLPNWVPDWAGDLWVLSFILALIQLKASYRSNKILIKKKILDKFLVKVFIGLRSLFEFLLFWITFLSIPLALFSPFLFVFALKHQNTNWWKEILGNKSKNDMILALAQKIKSGNRDKGIEVLFYIIGVMTKTYSAIVLATIFFAINAYGVDLT